MTTAHITSRFCKTIPAALAAAFALIGSTAQAIPVQDSLANLVTTGGSVAVGDKTFSSFRYVNDGLTSFNPANIMVTASVVGDVYYLTYSGNIALAATGPATADLVLGYTVTASAGLIWMIDQEYTGSGSTSAVTGLTVDETVKSTEGGSPIIAHSHLEIGDPSDPFAEIGDDLDTTTISHPNGYAQLAVTKDINLAVFSGTGQVSVSVVSQSFHQQVPEGGSAIALLGMALIGIEGLRRKLGIALG